MPCEHQEHANCPIAEAQKAFHARITAQLERAQEFLDANRCGADERAQLAGARLGTFAGGRVHAGRFAGLVATGDRAEPEIVARVDEAAATLTALTDRVNEMTKIDAAGETLHAAVARALREIGLVFGAARTIELARTGRYDLATHGRLVLGVPFAEWSPAERGVAPSIRVRIGGESLHAAGLAEFLDGGLKLVLKIEGACSPVPLVRLATPGVYVAQVTSRKDLAGFLSYDGPAIAAFVPDGAALFTHDPRAGSRSWERFDVVELPRAPRRALGGLSTAQQREEILLLREFAAPPPEPEPTESETEPAVVDPTDKLASWLLGQAGLTQKPSA